MKHGQGYLYYTVLRAFFYEALNLFHCNWTFFLLAVCTQITWIATATYPGCPSGCVRDLHSVCSLNARLHHSSAELTWPRSRNTSSVVQVTPIFNYFSKLLFGHIQFKPSGPRRFILLTAIQCLHCTHSLKLALSASSLICSLRIKKKNNNNNWRYELVLSRQVQDDR